MSRRIAPVAVVVAHLLAATALRGQDSQLDRYVAWGLEHSLSVADRELAARQADARWSEARRAYLPSLELEARYSRATGGRSFEIPTGDLMNPVYDALNGIRQGQGQPASFPTIDNQRIDFLRGREQETHLRLSQVLFNPAIRADIRGRRFETIAERAGVEAARAKLERDIKVAYYAYANATRATAILSAAVELVAESDRSTTGLWRASLVTRDQVHRTRAERLEVEQEWAEARVAETLAASYLNQLLNRAPDSPIEVDPTDLQLPSGAVRQAHHALTTASGTGDEYLVSSLVGLATARRAELRQLESATLAAEAGASAIRGSMLPSLAFAVDAGIQGEGYGLGSDDRFLMASLVLSWNVTSGGSERARLRGARLAAERLRTQREDLASRIRLEVESAARRALVALQGVRAVEERVQEAEGAFRLVRRKQAEGLATALEFLDARAALTRAQLGKSITEAEALIRLAELEYAAASPAAAVLVARTLEDNR